MRTEKKAANPLKGKLFSPKGPLEYFMAFSFYSNDGNLLTLTNHEFLIRLPDSTSSTSTTKALPGFLLVTTTLQDNRRARLLN